MTNANRTAADLLALWHRCDYCRSEPGVWCVVAQGRTVGTPAVWLHADRVYPVQSAQYLGHTSARRWALEEIIREIRTAGDRWADLPPEPTMGDLLDLLEQRAEIARRWEDTADSRVFVEVPEAWIR